MLLLPIPRCVHEFPRRRPLLTSTETRQDLTYWKSGIATAGPLAVSGETVYELIEDGIYTGLVKSQSSRNILERFGDVSSLLIPSAYLACTSLKPILLNRTSSS